MVPNGLGWTVLFVAWPRNIHHHISPIPLIDHTGRTATATHTWPLATSTHADAQHDDTTHARPRVGDVAHYMATAHSHRDTALVRYE